MFLVDDLPGLEESVVIPLLVEYVAFQAEHTTIGRVADVVDPWTAFDVAPADHHERLIPRRSEWSSGGCDVASRRIGGADCIRGRQSGLPVSRQEWICEIDRCGY